MTEQDTLKEYARLKALAETQRAAQQRAEGALALNLKQLKAQFGCVSRTEADAKISQLNYQREQLKVKLERELSKLRKRWANELGTDT